MLLTTVTCERLVSSKKSTALATMIVDLEIADTCRANQAPC